LRPVKKCAKVGPRMTASERTFEVSPGLHLAARVHGPDDGAPMLAMHGWLDNAATFDGLAPLLPGRRIVALDLAGHGLSGRRVGAPYHFIDYIADVAAVADLLGWQTFDLMGHSLGAGVAALLAGAWPERVRRLVLLEGLGPMTDDEARAPERLREALAAESEGRRRGNGPRTGYADAEQVAQRLASAVGMQASSARTLLGRGLVAQDNGRFDWRADGGSLRLPSRLRMTEAQVAAYLGAITAKTLLVRAEPGMPASEAYFSGRAAKIAGLAWARLPGGHHVHLDDPAAVAAVVGPFLAQSQ
jgi:pimeloyl-ACP methyl ester carboxylesterase